MKPLNFFAVDLGATSGRTILASFDGNKVNMAEVTRFANPIIPIGGHLFWDIPALYNAVRRAYEKGIVICVASGNEAKNDKGAVDEYCYPGFYHEVVEVGAINKHKEPSYFSNSNNLVDCVTYGEEILSTFKGQSFAVLDGTSMATPIVSGCVILLQQWFEKEFGRKPSKDEVYASLVKCSSIIEGYSRKQIGFGYIDLNKLEQ